MFDRSTEQGHQFNALPLIFHEVATCNLAPRKLFGQLQPMLHECRLIHGLEELEEVQVYLGRVSLAGSTPLHVLF
jgi:hypothetical protein